MVTDIEFELLIGPKFSDEFKRAVIEEADRLALGKLEKYKESDEFLNYCDSILQKMVDHPLVMIGGDEKKPLRLLVCPSDDWEFGIEVDLESVFKKETKCADYELLGFYADELEKIVATLRKSMKQSGEK